MRSRGWCFTINNDRYSDLDGLMDMSFKYVIFGFEEGKDGTEHIQGFIYFYDAKTMSSVKKGLPRAHLEIAKGSVSDNYNYCSKAGDFYEFGDRPQQGSIGRDKLEYVMANPLDNFHLYNQYVKNYKKLMNEMRDVDVDDKSVEMVSSDNVVSLMIECKKDGKKCVYLNDIKEYVVEDDIVIMNWEDCVSSMDLEIWKKGLGGYRILRGYEVVEFNPVKIYLVWKNVQGYNMCNKKYYDIIDKAEFNAEL